MKLVNLYYPIEKVTEKAVALRIDEKILVWLPKSQIKAYKRQVQGVTQYKTVVPYWLAEEKGLLVKDFNGNYVYISDADIIRA
jgi:ligand-binding sensor domain-containing protein